MFPSLAVSRIAGSEAGRPIESALPVEVVLVRLVLIDNEFVSDSLALVRLEERERLGILLVALMCVVADDELDGAMMFFWVNAALVLV